MRVAMAHDGQGGKDNGQYKEHICLDEADKQLEYHHGGKYSPSQPAGEDAYDHQQHCAGKSVTEKSQA